MHPGYVGIQWDQAYVFALGIMGVWDEVVCFPFSLSHLPLCCMLGADSVRVSDCEIMKHTCEGLNSILPLLHSDSQLILGVSLSVY